uniref:Serpentine receptor class gamma n=1 Tax=Caenorhabditis tropicalis TaxID=1561998 RepID=A0A1I7U988_9PELO
MNTIPHRLMFRPEAEYLVLAIFAHGCLKVDNEHGKKSLLFSSVFYLLLIFFLNILIFVKASQRLSNSDIHKEVLRRLSFITIVNTTIYTIVLFYHVHLFFLATYIQLPFLSVDLMMVVSDLITFSMSYMMILFDKNVREAIFYCCYT